MLQTSFTMAVRLTAHDLQDKVWTVDRTHTWRVVDMHMQRP